MNTYSQQEYDEFVNAIQLCIQNLIVASFGKSHPPRLSIHQQMAHDPGFTLLQRLLPGTWDAAEKNYLIDLAAIAFPMPLLTQFLLLSRLQEASIKKLAEIDERYRPIVQRLGLDAAKKVEGQPIASLAVAAAAIITAMEQQRLTIRTVADRAGVTQVTVSKFKAGGDVMLSTLLKLASAVGIEMAMRKKKG